MDFLDRLLGKGLPDNPTPEQNADLKRYYSHFLRSTPMKLFLLTCCNPEAEMDNKLNEVVEMLLDPQGSLHLTFEGAEKTVRDAIASSTGNDPDYIIAWDNGHWSPPVLTFQDFNKWEFSDEETGDVWLIREMPVFGTDAYPE